MWPEKSPPGSRWVLGRGEKGMPTRGGGQGASFTFILLPWTVGEGDLQGKGLPTAGWGGDGG